MAQPSHTEADRVWQELVSIVLENFHSWKQKASTASGLAFSRVRALMRLEAEPKSLRELSEALLVDAPATTVIVNDLVRRALVEKVALPTNGRVKLVTLTDAGRGLLQRISELHEPTPPAVAELGGTELSQLALLVRRIRASSRHREK